MGISEEGVKAHLSRLYLRYGVTNRVALLAALAEADGDAVSTLGDLRVLASRAHDRGLVMRDDVPLGGDSSLAIVRNTLASVDSALDLVRDLPADTTGPVIAVLRARIAAALTALDAAAPPAATGAVRTR